MNRRIVVAVALVLVAVVAASLIGAGAYRAGVARGLAEAGRLPAPDPSHPALPYAYGPYWHHGPFGFGFFGFLFPLLGVLLILGLLRALFWGVWCRGFYHRWDTRVPSAFEEWHRRAHESAPRGTENA